MFRSEKPKVKGIVGKLNAMGTNTVNWNLQMGNNDIDPDINLFNGVMERDQYVDFNRLKLKIDN